MPEDWIRFYLYKGPSFVGSERGFEEADYAVFGVPFDSTASYRPGSRFAPLALRNASEYLEFPREDEIRLADLGDLPLTNDVNVMLDRVGRVVDEIVGAGKVPVILGGEHTLTLSSASKIDKNVALVVFDAHLDMRDEYMDTRVNHATWLRRLIESKDLEKVLVLGARAFIDEELAFAEDLGVEVVTSLEIETNFNSVKKKISDVLSNFSGVYLSLDIDVLDPGFAPGVSNPEPGGISPIKFFELVRVVSAIGLKGLDVVEVNPVFDNGGASANAVYAVYAALLASTTSS